MDKLFTTAFYWIAFVLILIGALNYAVMGFTSSTFNPIEEVANKLIKSPAVQTTVKHSLYVLIGVSGLAALALSKPN